MKLLTTFSLFVFLLLTSACKKQLVENLAPYAAVSPTVSNWSSPYRVYLTEYYIYNNSSTSANSFESGAFLAQFTKNSTSVEATAVAVEEEVVGSTEDFLFSGRAYSKNEMLSYRYSPPFWKSEKSADFPRFRYKPDLRVSLDPITSNRNIYTNNPYVLEVSGNTGADSTYFTLQNQTRAFAGSVNSCTFSVSDLSQLRLGSSTIIVQAIAYKWVEIGGIPMRFRKEVTHINEVIIR